MAIFKTTIKRNGKRVTAYRVVFDNKTVGYGFCMGKANQLLDKAKEQKRKASGKFPKGITFYKPTQSWRATITFKKQTHFVGYFDTIEQAVHAKAKHEAQLLKQQLQKDRFEAVHEMPTSDVV